MGEQVGVFLIAEDGSIEAVFGGITVGQGYAVSNVQSAAAIGFAEKGAFHGVVLAGLAGGRVGGVGCHNATSFMRHYTWPRVVKKAAGGM